MIVIGDGHNECCTLNDDVDSLLFVSAMYVERKKEYFVLQCAPSIFASQISHLSTNGCLNRPHSNASTPPRLSTPTFPPPARSSSRGTRSKSFCSCCVGHVRMRIGWMPRMSYHKRLTFIHTLSTPSIFPSPHRRSAGRTASKLPCIQYIGRVWLWHVHVVDFRDMIDGRTPTPACGLTDPRPTLPTPNPTGKLSIGSAVVVSSCDGGLNGSVSGAATAACCCWAPACAPPVVRCWDVLMWGQGHKRKQETKQRESN